MTHKHSCPDCATTSTFEQDWLDDLPFVVVARHIHTGKISDTAQFATQAQAEAYCADMRARCTSHENFVVVERQAR